MGGEAEKMRSSLAFSSLDIDRARRHEKENRNQQGSPGRHVFFFVSFVSGRKGEKEETGADAFSMVISSDIVMMSAMVFFYRDLWGYVIRTECLVCFSPSFPSTLIPFSPLFLLLITLSTPDPSVHV